MIRQSATIFAGLDKVDNAQMIQMERLFIAKLVPGFDASTDVPKKIWTTDPIYAGARSAVEEIWQGIQDWNEILWSAHAVYDATFGQFVRREFFQRLATVYGDTLDALLHRAVADLLPDHARRNRRPVRLFSSPTIRSSALTTARF